ncbi:MAG: rRNA maturation RNase YbeY [Candidatus Pacebacteria bacterium CG10_big_fil_rev_8_21_14_0_10_36_11]|nr:rRNA maturation RNase YbeY [Candidatus Pacearchaeota archaeon]OIP74358.1 MAG: rRNA maturation RNase YbeY [Candidatus Pacebacteria bacterium CG2_30_36_39]PIR64922.1 MAG: rRNA maturation RNase YbeY [Candidatus Pacebacteria bacterium CG10_big_fil_rev_8_21_14_0_10_36_11]PJC42806.1 MAG: rRNA maturation RNase YbeY [Candidatus Pacebacteria bacterium CG_4_9_14_0_2_um_filter_36_8]
MILVNFYIGSRYPVSRKRLRQTVEDVLKKNGVEKAQVDVSIVGVRKIQTLNETLLQHDGPTDVLSFPHHNKKQLDEIPLPTDVPPHLGDVVISFPESIKMAKKFGKRVDDQICFYLEHGLMHLLGYHHD